MFHTAWEIEKVSGTENGFLRPICPKSVPDTLSTPEGAELVLIGCQDDLGIDLKSHPKDEETVEIFRDLHLEGPVRPHGGLIPTCQSAESKSRVFEKSGSLTRSDGRPRPRPRTDEQLLCRPTLCSIASRWNRTWWTQLPAGPTTVSKSWKQRTKWASVAAESSWQPLLAIGWPQRV